MLAKMGRCAAYPSMSDSTGRPAVDCSNTVANHCRVPKDAPWGRLHHFSPKVSDVEASAQWYERVFGMDRFPASFPHYGAEQRGYAVFRTDPRSGTAIGLHHHNANPGQPFHESRTGLDHMSFGVAERADLDAWASWLDDLGIKNSGVIDTDNPVPYSVVVLRDPDNIQLELCHMAR